MFSIYDQQCPTVLLEKDRTEDCVVRQHPGFTSSILLQNVLIFNTDYITSDPILIHAIPLRQSSTSHLLGTAEQSSASVSLFITVHHECISILS